MKTLFCAALLAVPLSAADAPKTAAPAAKAARSEDDRAIYAIGYLLGRNIQPFSLSAAELAILETGLRASAAGKSSDVNINTYTPRIQDLLERRTAKAVSPVKEAGKAFAEKFAKEEGVKPIPNGGWYKISQEGSGELASADDTLKVHYRGTHLDGSEFDSSYKRAAPLAVGLQGGVIPCWTNALGLLKAGAKARLVCPSEVAYGDRGNPPAIKGGETLIFDVEIAEIVRAPKK